VNKNLLEVNKIYSEQNPSRYLKNPNTKNIELFVNNTKNFFLKKLKLPARIFQNSSLLDLGCGSGQNTIFYDWNGANCTLVDYDRKSFLFAKSLFEKFSKNKFKIYNKDLFKFKSNKKFDYVILNGVAHHTHDVRKTIKIAINFLKKGGMLILGIGETNGFFQRHFQRNILYNLTSDKKEIINLSKYFFKENLLRAKKFGGRTETEIIYDTYLNPKIKTLSFDEVKNIFNKKKLYLYSQDEGDSDLETFYNIGAKQFRLLLKGKDYFSNKNFSFNSINNFSLSKEKSSIFKKNIKKINKISKLQNKLTNLFNDQSIKNIKKNYFHRFLYKYLKEIKNYKKIDLIDKKNLIQFVNEIDNTLKILKLRDKKSKIKKLKNAFKKNNRLFRKFNGKGMNYFVGFKC
jgi:SAM-dependent methyltransferase